MTENQIEDAGDMASCALPPAGWSCSRAPGHSGPCAASPVYDGEAKLAAWRMNDPEAQPEGTLESLITCATMLEEYGPDCFPANEHGQVAFARCMTDAVAAEIRAYARTQAAAKAAYEARVAELEAALRPFSAALGDVAENDLRWADADTIEFDGFPEYITVGDLRRARSTLKETRP